MAHGREQWQVEPISYRVIVAIGVDSSIWLPIIVGIVIFDVM